MEDLDAEIFQTAAALSEFNFQSQSRKTQPPGVDLERMNQMVGGELVGLFLANGGSQSVPEILVQIALQAALSAWSHSMLCSWALRASDASTKFWRELFTEIQRSEDSKDAARWRAITRKQLNKRAPLSEVKNWLLAFIYDVLILVKPRNEPPSRRKIDADCGDRIAVIARLVLEFNKAIGTQVVSEDLEAFIVAHRAKFEPEAMENMWAVDKIDSLETVVCTTGLGLRTRGHNAGEGMIISKPKVLLPSILSELVG
ncbi:hypothetical protein C8R43DRAFT_1186498 [Mycena crocata]|nr:hypothetical protein C8R43DRAFT_1186498 [Mycena crocata]